MSFATKYQYDLPVLHFCAICEAQNADHAEISLITNSVKFMQQTISSLLEGDKNGRK